MSRPETDRPTSLQYSGPCDWPGCDHPAVVLVANEAGLMSAEYAEAYRCRWHKNTPVSAWGDRPICPECFTVRAVNGECGCVG